MFELTHFAGSVTQAGVNLANQARAGIAILTSGHPVPTGADNVPLTHEARLMLAQIEAASKR